MSRRWWDQAGIDLKEAKKRAVEAATVSELESEVELDVESNEYLGREEESKGAIGSRGAEWSGADE